MNAIELLETPGIAARDKILAFEKKFTQLPGVQLGDSDICPVKHKFSDGIYVREMFIPKDTVLIGKLHRHSHPSFFLSGEMIVFTESGGIEHVKAPKSIISPAGTKRIGIAVEDSVWITVHANKSNTHDIKKIEEFTIAKSYEDLEVKGFLGMARKMNKLLKKLYGGVV